MSVIQDLRDSYQRNPAEALGMIPKLFEAVDEGKIIELPCKPGGTLYVISQKQFTVGNNSFPDPCENCELYELYEDYKHKFIGEKYQTCKKSFCGTCPQVVKPITVELFEVRKDGVFPCYNVEFEGNSQIEDWYLTRESAEEALGKMKKGGTRHYEQNQD